MIILKIKKKKSMRIHLDFPQQIHYVTGSKYGKTVFDEQIKDQVKISN